MVSAFQEKIYAKLKEVPKGKVTTYKELANAIGTRAYRAVGLAMRNNPYLPKVPCHRVVNSGGCIGGYKGVTSGKAIEEKIALLNKEGISIKDNKVQQFDRVLHKFY